MEDRNGVWEKVEKARYKERPSAKYYIEQLVGDFIEVHGDRCYGEDAAIIGGIGKIDNIPVTIIGISKGETVQENRERNYGMPKPSGYKKALRLMKQAEKFKRPIICLIDTPGAFCGVEAEEKGIGYAIANNILEMSRIQTPIISVFIGEGGSGGALALGVADKVLMLENAIYSILSPEGFATILWKDITRAKEAAQLMKITASNLLEMGIIDCIIKEPHGGAHTNPRAQVEILREAIFNELIRLYERDITELVKVRYEKFRYIDRLALGV